MEQPRHWVCPLLNLFLLRLYGFPERSRETTRYGIGKLSTMKPPAVQQTLHQTVAARDYFEWECRPLKTANDPSPPVLDGKLGIHLEKNQNVF